MPALVTPQKLLEHWRTGREALEPHRKLRVEAYKEYLGQHYPGTDATKRHLNLISRAIHVLIPHILTNNPLHDVETERLDLDPAAALLSLYLDKRAVNNRRVHMARLCLQDAFLGPKAIVKCGMRVGDEVMKIQGRWYNLGEPYQRRIAFDDWNCDPSASCQEDLTWEGDSYTVLREQVLEAGIFNNAVFEKLPTTMEGELAHNRGGSRRISHGSTSDYARESLLERVRLIDVAIYDEGRTYIVTLPDDPDYAGDYLRIKEHEGAARGPYEWLELHPVNDQLHGKPPVSDWREQSEAFYTIVAKMIQQIEETKRLLIAGKGVSDDEIDAIRDAEDGDTVRVDDPTQVKVEEFGGYSESAMDALQLLLSWSNISQGQTDLLAGQGADTDKVGIYEGMRANANAMVEDYREISDEFLGRLSRHDAWHAIYDPLIQVPLTYRLPGGERIQVVYDETSRRGDYLDYNFKIRPRSTMAMNPEVRVGRLIQLLGLVLQGAEVAMATQGMVDPAAIARIGGEELDTPKLAQIIREPALLMSTMQTQMAMPGPGQGQIAGPVQGMNPNAPTYRIAPAGNGAGSKKPGGATAGAPRPKPRLTA